MTLQEFTMQSSYGAGSGPSRGLTHEEMLRLPTGPKERSAEEMQYGRLGGGFSNYGNRPGSVGSGQGMDRGRDFESGRRSYGFEDENPRGRNQARVSDFNALQQPSRADGIENWASMKKSLPDYNSGAARSGGKYSSLGGNTGVGGSRADEVDSWASMKKPISLSQHPQPRSSSFGSGFSRPESESWTRNETQRLVLESPKDESEAVAKVNKPNPFGTARPREEVLAEKGLDWKKLDMDLEVKKQPPSAGGSRPTSSHSSRPQSSQSSKSEVPASLLPGMAEGTGKQKSKVNPFGDAKPREVLLEEKGLDWKKIDLDLDHRRVDRPETEEEKNLKEEIEQLTKELQQKSGKDQASVNEIILQKQQELDHLVRQLDDKVRYSQKAFERHGSGAGRGAGFHDRPPSRPGAPDTGAGFHDRPPSMREVYEEHRTGFPQRPNSRPGLYDDPRASYADRAPPQAGAYEDPRIGFSERPPSRPGAYEDPHSGFSERPHSRPGVYEEPRVPERSSFTPGPYHEQRAVDYGERPRSRGTMNSWGRPRDDRRATQGGGGGGRGFLGNRDVERSGSRW
ncbi:hepatoma-derived growth factor-related protein 2 [Dorcoceras hygrometricum]|uniref:Hepatoma-derived growth factor-related protein 2 n=1 Tax=Dorcoceras hygrometricum TaxID=472368 RepID=A0A2Z7C6Y1_9LAMI|nr:hepatoma-derived growth factor-related protein 2 [Dorcoceras hygrometricum]